MRFKHRLFLLALTSTTLVAHAAPVTKPARPQWQYAVLELGSIRVTGTKTEMGVKLCLPHNKTTFLAVANSQSPEYKAFILNRLGGEGWELVAVNGYNGGEARYVFKRLG